MDDLVAAPRSLTGPVCESGSTRRRFGQCEPQLIARLKLLSPCAGVPSFFGRGEEDTIRWAKAGFVAPNGFLLSWPPTAKRSHRSRAGSARGDFKACFSFLTLTAGVLSFSTAGDESGDELRARFLPRRGTRGETEASTLSWFVCHKRRSLGDVFFSWFSGSGTPMRSCQAKRLTGVAVLPFFVFCPGVSSSLSPAFLLFEPPPPAESSAVTPSSRSVDDSSEVGWWNWNCCSLVLVLAETAMGGLGGGGFGGTEPE